MSTAEVLTPLRARYARWLELSESDVRHDRAEAPDEIRAIQLLLRLERGANPSREVALALAATGCAALCLDPRSGPGGKWHDDVAAYCRGHIRKVTRRGRGAQWAAAAEIDGLGLVIGDTEIRVLVPGLIADLDKRVSKLQVGGTDIPANPGAGTIVRFDAEADIAQLSTENDPCLTLFVPQSGLTAGKLMAQTGHAGMLAAALLAGSDEGGLIRWRAAGHPSRVESVGDVRWTQLLEAVADPARAWRERRLLAVRDAGFTEVTPGTVTVIAGF